MRVIQPVHIVLASSIFLSAPAHAHGEEALIVPIGLVFILHLIPLADLLRRRLWMYAALYVVTQPFVWFVAVGAAYLFGWLGNSSMAALAGVILLAILPFVYWRHLLRWSRG